MSKPLDGRGLQIKNFNDNLIKICQEEEIRLASVVGGNTGAVKKGRYNPSLRKMLEIQELIGHQIINLVDYGVFEGSGVIDKCPDNDKKMAEISRLTYDPDWQLDKKIVARVQKITKTMKD